MRALWSAINFLLIMHVVGALGFVGWMRFDGRLNADRLQKAVDVFSMTVKEEQVHLEKAAQLEAEARQRAADLAHMEQVATGPASIDELLGDRAQASEIADAKLDHLDRVVRDLQRRIELERQIIQKQVKELAAERAAFEAYREAELAKIRDEQFQRAVATMEQLKPRQGKDVFQQLLAEGKEEQVIDYLAQMQLRKAAAILREFKAPEEIAQASTLIEQLRARGIEIN